MKDIIFSPCAKANAKRETIQAISRFITHPVEIVHVNITGKMSLPSSGGMQYGFEFVDEFTTMPDICFSDTKAELYKAMVYYNRRSENVIKFPLVNLPHDRTGENNSTLVQKF